MWGDEFIAGGISEISIYLLPGLGVITEKKERQFHYSLLEKMERLSSFITNLKK